MTDSHGDINILTDTNLHGDICSGNICPVDICRVHKTWDPRIQDPEEGFAK